MKKKILRRDKQDSFEWNETERDKKRLQEGGVSLVCLVSQSMELFFN